MKRAHSKKFLAYSAMAASFTIGAQKSFGQVNVIAYSDIDPDEIHNAGDPLFELDVNNDGIIDFNLNIYTFVSVPLETLSGDTVVFPGNILYATPMEGNAVAGYLGASSYVYPLAFSAGDTIDNTRDFYGSSHAKQSMIFSAYGYTSSGSSFVQVLSQGSFFGGVTDKFLGLRFAVDDEQFYGWLRLDVAEDNKSYTVKDYAYNILPEMGLEAGQLELLDIPKIDADRIQAYSFGNTIYIRTFDLHAALAGVEVLNTLGQNVYNNKLNQDGMQIQLNNTTEGIYTLHILANGATYSKQLFIHQQ